MAIVQTMAQSSLPLSAAAALNGVLAATAYTWRDKGQEDPDSPYAPFALAVEMASAINMEATVQEWQDVTRETKQWTGWATFAERMWPDTFAKKSQGSQQPQTVVNIGIVDGRVQELKAKGELTYGGG